jgi:ketosteroid isomerase-like protein
MIDTSRIDAWLARYRAAWASADREDIARLFTDDVRYFTAPYDEPLEGVEEVVVYWLGEDEAVIPWTFEHAVIAREGDLYVVQGVTRYPEGTRDAGGRAEVFHNLWLVTLTSDDRASEFVEYWMLADQADGGRE